MTDKEFKYLKESILTDLAEFLAEDFGMGVNESLDTLYNSATYMKLSDPATGLYYQSSRYIYSYLKNELTTGTVA